MDTLIFEGHFYNCVNNLKEEYNRWTNERTYNYGVCVRVDINDAQIQFVSHNTKPVEWPQEEKMLAFNEAYIYLQKLIDADSPLFIFKGNIFSPGIEKNIEIEQHTDFTIEIPVDKNNHRILSEALLQIKEARDNFSRCKDKLQTVLDRGSSLINENYYSIIKIIDYLSDINNAGVVTGPSSDSLRKIRIAVAELKDRKIAQNNTYQSLLSTAKREIYLFEFPKIFKSDLPYTEIRKVIDEIR